MTKLCSGEAGFHCEGEHHGGKLYGRPRQEEQGLRRLHHKGAGRHYGGGDANADGDELLSQR